MIREGRFLANENFPQPSVRLLRVAGLDVIAVAEDAPRLPDAEVLAWSRREQRILLTFDRDYGDLIFHRHHPPPPGVILFRTDQTPPEDAAHRLLGLVIPPVIAFEGMFTTIHEHGFRQRPLP